MCTAIEHTPGKFEGEGCITRLAYAWHLGGMCDECGSTEDGTPCVFYGPFTPSDFAAWGTPVCEECQIELAILKRLYLYEFNDGFVTTTGIEVLDV